MNLQGGFCMSKLEKFVQEAKEFAKKDITASNPDFIAWNNSLIRFMETKYGSNSTTTANFKKRRYSLSVYALGTPESSFINAYKRDMEITLRELEILLNEEEDSEDESVADNSKKSSKNNSKKVFIVHGRDDSKKYELSGFLYEQGLEPIILHEQVNNGQTIIEKIEKNSDVGCAIIILTPDDEGKLKNSDMPLKTRARQNVIFEAGYFMGKLGRNRTILLSGVEETMSDIDGIVYLNINNYKGDLLKELRSLNLIKQYKIGEKMNKEFVKMWLNNLKEYWFNKDVESVVSLFAKTSFYQETPFMIPQTNIEKINLEWQHIKDEDIHKIEFKILALDGYTVIVEWLLEQNEKNYDGIYEIKFNNELECIYFKSWEMEKQK